MTYPIFFESRKSENLFGLKKEFDLLSSLYKKKNLPKVTLLSGEKGSGKSTLINHFFLSIFDKKNYDLDKQRINKTSILFNHLNNDICENFIYVKGSDFQSVKVEDIRKLKTKMFKSSISNNSRFIILDDIELFNNNSLNALLKIIEEPNRNNYFILIYNKSKLLLETIRSRTLEIKIILKDQNRLQIINKLMNHFQVEFFLDPSKCKISPGNFLKFNYICKEYDISLKNDFIDNLSKLLNLYKKNKDILFINVAYFVSDYYFKSLIEMNILNVNDVYERKNIIFNNLNAFLKYNINQNSLMTEIASKLK